MEESLTTILDQIQALVDKARTFAPQDEAATETAVETEPTTFNLDGLE